MNTDKLAAIAIERLREKWGALITTLADPCEGQLRDDVVEVIVIVEPLIHKDERERIVEYADPWWDGNCCEPTPVSHGIVATCCQNGRDRIIEARTRTDMLASVQWRHSVGDPSWSVECLTDNDDECAGCMCTCHAERVAARLVEVICEQAAELANYDGAPAWYAR